MLANTRCETEPQTRFEVTRIMRFTYLHTATQGEAYHVPKTSTVI